jgi:hypothetical protein
MFLKTFDQWGYLDPYCVQLGSLPRIVPRAAATPVGQIILAVTFGTRENFCMESIEFEVTDLEKVYNAFMGWPTLSKFMGRMVSSPSRETSGGLSAVTERVVRLLTNY